MITLLSTWTFGVTLAFVALGVFVSYRLFRFPDITTDGAFTLGAVAATRLIVSGHDPLVATLADHDPAWGPFRFYLERHIAHDDEKHAPVCRRIMARLCGNDATKWAEASATARECLEARIALWDAITADL